MDKKVIIGNVGKDLEVKTSKAGKEYASFTVAVTQQKKAGQAKAESRWYNCMLFGNSAIYDWIKKGAKVYVEGVDEATVSEKDGKVYYSLLVNRIQIIQFAKDESSAVPSAPVNNQPIDDLPF